MTSIMLSMLLIFSFILGSITYVYLYRGKARYENLGEYLRKGWPIFSPLNCLLYMFTQSKARHPIINLDNFHELDEIQNNWEVIREEVVNLYRQRYFELTKKPGSQAFSISVFAHFSSMGGADFILNGMATLTTPRKSCAPTRSGYSNKFLPSTARCFPYCP